MAAAGGLCSRSWPLPPSSPQTQAGGPECCLGAQTVALPQTPGLACRGGGGGGSRLG